MTAVLPPARPVPAGRHRAPDASSTGSLGPIPREWAGRGAHGSAAPGGPGGRRDSRPAPAPRNRAVRTAGLSLAALGAVAGAGGAATHGLLPSDEPATTGEVALPTNLAASSMSLPAAGHQVAASAVSTVMPVVAAGSPVRTPQYKSVAAASRQAPAAQPAVARPAAARPAPSEPAADQGSSVAAEAIQAAKAKLGKPYVWGATGPNSFDCSGLMQYAFGKAGTDLPRTSAAQSKVGDKVSMDELEPGDLIFLYQPVSHVVMYVGNGKVIEAPNSGEDVRFTPLSKIEKNAVSARRVV